jgi:hypothetical protein
MDVPKQAGVAALSAPGRGSLAKTASSGSPFRFFSPSSFWNTPVAEAPPLDPSSPTLVSALTAIATAEEQTQAGPGINTTSYSVPIYTVPANQPTVRVWLVNHPSQPTLESAWRAVPLPSNAQPAIGTDGLLVVWQPSTDRMWEFWRLAKGLKGWQAWWGGATQNVSSNPGVYGPEAWLGAKPWWGATASSLSIAGGLITLEDLQHGEIKHALAIEVPNVRLGVYASPARRDDGKSTSPSSLPEGAHLRLNPKLDLAALHLPRLTSMIAQAAQRYGIFVTNGARDIAFLAQDPVPTGTNPFLGPGGYFEGQTPSQLLAAFPWSELQVLKMELHQNGTTG